MKLAVALLGLLAVAKCTVADGCKRKDADRCMNILVDQLTSGKYKFCGTLREYRTCLLDLNERCLSDAARNYVSLQQKINELNEKIERICATDEKNGSGLNLDEIDTSGVSDKEREMMECVADEGKLTTYVGQCLEVAIADIRKRRFRYRFRMANNCQTYMAIANCVSDKVSNTCGEPVREPFFHGMMLALKTEDPRAAASSKCAVLIKKAEEFNDNAENKRKRRSIEKVQFSKLMP